MVEFFYILGKLSLKTFEHIEYFLFLKGLKESKKSKQILYVAF